MEKEKPSKERAGVGSDGCQGEGRWIGIGSRSDA